MAAYALAGAPLGALLVFQNGLLGKAGADYTVGLSGITITPTNAATGDLFSFLYMTGLSIGYGFYTGIKLIREDWVYP